MVTKIEKTSSNTYRYIESQTVNGVMVNTVDETYAATTTVLKGAARQSAIVEAIKNAFPETRNLSVVLRKVEK